MTEGHGLGRPSIEKKNFSRVNKTAPLGTGRAEHEARSRKGIVVLNEAARKSLGSVDEKSAISEESTQSGGKWLLVRGGGGNRRAPGLIRNAEIYKEGESARECGKKKPLTTQEEEKLIRVVQ